MVDIEVMELLGVANGYLDRVRLEYNRINEVNSWKAAVYIREGHSSGFVITATVSGSLSLMSSPALI